MLVPAKLYADPYRNIAGGRSPYLPDQARRYMASHLIHPGIGNLLIAQDVCHLVLMSGNNRL